MPHDLRIEFSQKAVQLCQVHNTISFCSIVVAKQGVYDHLRDDESLIYNYFIKSLLIDKIRAFRKVTLIPDPRGIAPNSGRPLDHYLQGVLFENGIETGQRTELGVKQIDSQAEMGLQFADMLAGAIQSHYEDANSDCYRILKPYMACHEYYFQQARQQAAFAANAANHSSFEDLPF
ncbi:hypothetical protein BH688_03015 [Kushneria phosphatilytica]|nr:hypothetical protein BH688_03015 [Kushneria phosphatilytica]